MYVHPENPGKQAIHREPVRRKDFREEPRDEGTRISSQGRYDHFDTLPCFVIIPQFFEKRKGVFKKTR